MLMRDLKPLVLKALIEDQPGVVGGIDYRLYTTLIDIVVVSDAPHAYLLARTAREAEAKVATASTLYEAFQTVTLVMSPTVPVPPLPAWLGCSAMTIEGDRARVDHVVLPKACDYRYRGCLWHISTPYLRGMMKVGRHLDRWSLEDLALEWPLQTLKSTAIDSIKSHFETRPALL